MKDIDPLIEAIEILRTKIMEDKEIYNGFVSSIETALNEAKPYTRERDLAVSILDRMVSIEREGR